MMRAASHWWTSLFLPCRLKHQNNLFNETEDVLYTLFHTARLIYSILLITKVYEYINKRLTWSRVRSCRVIMQHHHNVVGRLWTLWLFCFFASDWFKPVRTCVTWSFSSLSRIRAGWMILQVCTWSQADRQTKRRSGLIISLCGSPEGESPARAPPPHADGGDAASPGTPSN